MNLKDRTRGSLLAGGAGDALGYAIEFLRLNEIKDKYGKDGMTSLPSPALISDDTQMTLFTANGLIYGYTMAIIRGHLGSYSEHMRFAYKDWLSTQFGTTPEKKHAWLANIPELHCRRAPGTTCLMALESDKKGTLENPINASKGCGGIMRVAPVGLFFNPEFIYYNDPMEYICKIGAECGAITHGHPLGFISSAFTALLINLLTYRKFYKLSTLAEAIETANKKTSKVFSEYTDAAYFEEIINKAISLAQSNVDSENAILSLGEGWVAEETAAIAVFCSLRYENDIHRAICASANHDGDSDSTAAVTGNILGAWLGETAIEKAFDLNELELKDVILTIADDLAYAASQSDYDADFESDLWASKYIHVTFSYNN